MMTDTHAALIKEVVDLRRQLSTEIGKRGMLAFKELDDLRTQLAAMTAERDEALKQHPQLLATIRCMEIAQEASEAERDALVGAVIEQAASKYEELWRETDAYKVAQVRALATPDHHAALEAVKAKARAVGMRKAADINLITDAINDVHDMDVTLTDYAVSVSSAILAASEKEAGK